MINKRVNIYEGYNTFKGRVELTNGGLLTYEHIVSTFCWDLFDSSRFLIIKIAGVSPARRMSTRDDDGKLLLLVRKAHIHDIRLDSYTDKLLRQECHHPQQWRWYRHGSEKTWMSQPSVRMNFLPGPPIKNTWHIIHPRILTLVRQFAGGCVVI